MITCYIVKQSWSYFQDRALIFGTDGAFNMYMQVGPIPRFLFLMNFMFFQIMFIKEDSNVCA